MQALVKAVARAARLPKFPVPFDLTGNAGRVLLKLLCQLFESFSGVQSMFYISSVGFREMCKSSHEPIAPFPRSGGLLYLMQKLMRLVRLCLFAEVNATCCDTVGCI